MKMMPVNNAKSMAFFTTFFNTCSVLQFMNGIHTFPYFNDYYYTEFSERI